MSFHVFKIMYVALLLMPALESIHGSGGSSLMIEAMDGCPIKLDSLSMIFFRDLLVFFLHI